MILAQLKLGIAIESKLADRILLSMSRLVGFRV
jgi:hypothetical protein